MHITILPQKVRWLGGKELISALEVQRSILTNDMGCG
jgi:hypothetical protein